MCSQLRCANTFGLRPLKRPTKGGCLEDPSCGLTLVDLSEARSGRMNDDAVVGDRRCVEDQAHGTSLLFVAVDLPRARTQVRVRTHRDLVRTQRFPHELRRSPVYLRFSWVKRVMFYVQWRSWICRAEKVRFQANVAL